MPQNYPLVVELASDLQVRARKLAPFELDDHIKLEDPGPFQVEYLVAGGSSQFRTYDYENPDLTEPPETPRHLAQLNSFEEVLWKVWDRHCQALEHKEMREEAYAEYTRKCARYIFAECVHPEDLTRLRFKHFNELFRQLLISEVGLEDLSRVLRSVFQGYI